MNCKLICKITTVRLSLYHYPVLFINWLQLNDVLWHTVADDYGLYVERLRNSTHLTCTRDKPHYEGITGLISLGVASEHVVRYPREKPRPQIIKLKDKAEFSFSIPYSKRPWGILIHIRSFLSGVSRGRHY